MAELTDLEQQAINVIQSILGETYNTIGRRENYTCAMEILAYLKEKGMWAEMLEIREQPYTEGQVKAAGQALNAWVQDIPEAKIPKELYYFGTDLSNYGHYLFRIGTSEGDIGMMSLMSAQRAELPESVIKKVHSFQSSLDPKGAVSYHSMKLKDVRWSICAIIGSPKDERGGTCSVFFTPETVQPEDWYAILYRNDNSAKILFKMSERFKLQF